jgi:hypothetical protein
LHSNDSTSIVTVSGEGDGANVGAAAGTTSATHGTPLGNPTLPPPPLALEELRMARCRGDSGLMMHLHAAARQHILVNLQVLDLTGTPARMPSAATLACLPQLRMIAMPHGGQHAGPEDVQAAFECLAPKLEALEMSYFPALRDDAFARLATVHAAHLVHLHVPGTPNVSAAAWLALVRACVHLRYLNAAHAPHWTSSDLFAALPHTLEHLDLSSAGLVDTSRLGLIVEAAPQLHVLRLAMTQVTDRGVARAAALLPLLQVLDLSGCQAFSPASLAVLQRAYPKIRILWRAQS